MPEPMQPQPPFLVAALQQEVQSLRRVRDALEADNIYLRACVEQIKAEAHARITELESRTGVSDDNAARQ